MNIRYTLGISFLIIFLFIIPHTISASESPVIINEIMPNPDGSDLDYEWVEIYNMTKEDISLDECFLQEKPFDKKISIKAENFIVVTRDLLDKDSDGQSFEERYGDHSGIWGDNDIEDFETTEMVINLKNSSGYLTLGCHSFEETVTWELATSGQSFSKDSDSEWRNDYLVTPGKENSPVPPIIYSHTLIISEIYPSPITSEEESEWLELFNSGKKGIDLVGWSIRDTSKKHTFNGQLRILPGKHVVIHDEDLSITLNNTGDFIELYDPNEVRVDAFLYKKTTTGLSNIRMWKDGTYLKKIFLSQLPTPGKQNKFIDPNDIFYSVKEFTILQLRIQFPEEKVIIHGIVTVDENLLGKNTVYIEDSTGGIQTFISGSETLNTVLLHKDAEVEVVGMLRESNGELRLSVENENSIRILSSGYNREPYRISIDSLGEEHEGRLVMISGKISRTTGRTFYIQEGTSEIKILVKSSTGIPTPKKKKGQYAGIIGILSQYGEDEDGYPSYRILPRYASDIIISDSPISNEQLLANTGEGIIIFIILGVIVSMSGFIFTKKH